MPVTFHGLPSKPLPPQFQPKAVGTFPWEDEQTKIIVTVEAPGLSLEEMLDHFKPGEDRLIPTFYSENVMAKVVNVRLANTAEIHFVITAVAKTTELLKHGIACVVDKLAKGS